MTIDTVIEEYKQLIKDNKEVFLRECNTNPYEYQGDHMDNVRKFEQVVRWLEELKHYKTKFKNILMYDPEIVEQKLYEKAYTNAITEFSETLKSRLDFASGYPTCGEYDYAYEQSQHDTKRMIDILVKEMESSGNETK